ncbi:hypothetical protein [Spirosoma oryzicola]|uniref:hypothetical protein n=1 Tax=Spirosoma oryzicola TaxID=2898794 RepID=UPI001E2CB680|nr:hypothetical protein [Spirosoma oryzicola]UHG90112.1 hypothetical protein LQ777_17890 [Spirosoma oryzicola]
MTKGFFLAVSVIATLVLGLTFYLYYQKFYACGLGLSNSRETWGQFGDYVGGVSNPILSFITLLLTGYIAFKVAQSEEEKENREVRRHLFDLQFSEFKNVLDIMGRINGVPDLAQREAVSVLYVAEMGLISFASSNNFLFPFLNTEGNVYEILIERVRAIRKIYIEQEGPDVVLTPELDQAINAYWAASTAVRIHMQDFLQSHLR